MALTVERLEDGEVSPYLVDVMEPGDELELRGPVGGWFVWEVGRRRAGAARRGRLGHRAADVDASPSRRARKHGAGADARLRAHARRPDLRPRARRAGGGRRRARAVRHADPQRARRLERLRAPPRPGDAGRGCVAAGRAARDLRLRPDLVRRDRRRRARRARARPGRSGPSDSAADGEADRWTTRSSPRRKRGRRPPQRGLRGRDDERDAAPAPGAAPRTSSPRRSSTRRRRARCSAARAARRC